MKIRYPVDRKKTHITQGYSWRHKAIDIAPLNKGEGLPIYAVEDFAWDRVVQSNSRWIGYGNHIILKHRNGWTTLYAHLLSMKYKEGWKTGKAGDIIGYMGGKRGKPGSGKSTGVHVHFEMKSYGRPVNPMNYFIT